MDILTVGKLIELMENSGLSALEAEQDGLRVRLEKATRRMPMPDTVMPQNISSPVSEILESEQPEVNQTQIPDSSKAIRSPMVGVFHQAKDGKSEIGAKFKKGETICIIEAMKLMNEIVADEDGEIIWSAVEQGDTVEYDQLLFMYK